MTPEDSTLTQRLEAATTLIERALSRIDERIAAAAALTGDIDRITATVEQTRRESDLAEKLATAERELRDLKELRAGAPPAVLSTLRRTLPAHTSEMLAKHGIGDGPVDIKTLDAALTGLSLEQRIAVKSQLLRAGAIA